MPEKIGSYTIVSELGRGGMGVVYKARDESLDRFVAIKVLTEKLTEDDTFLQRFVREARAAAGVSHPNIVQIFYIGEDQGHPYFVMEYVTGQSLNHLLRAERQIGNPRAAQLILQAAHGLAAAHDRGIIHRDIKPANLMLDERGMVKIADFGLALPVAAETRLTATGMLVGTPGYLAPEQCRGESVDHRTDIYALGVTFYELLTGKPPFRGDSPLALLRQILDEEPPDIAALNPDADEETRRILAKMIAKDRAQRYQSCHEIITDLEEYLAQRGVRSVTIGLATRRPSGVEQVAASTAATQLVGAPTVSLGAPSASQKAPTEIVAGAGPATLPDTPLVAAVTAIEPGVAAGTSPAFAQPPAVAQAAAFSPAAPAAPRSSSRAVIIVLVLVLLAGGGIAAAFLSMKVYRGWRSGREQVASQTAVALPASSANPTPAVSSPAQTRTTEAGALAGTTGAPEILLSQGVNVPAQGSGAGQATAVSPQAPQEQPPQHLAAGSADASGLGSSGRGDLRNDAALRNPGPGRRRAEGGREGAAAGLRNGRAASGVGVAVTGDRGLVAAVSTVLTTEIDAAGLHTVDAQSLPATEDLLRGGDVPASRLIERLRREGLAVLVLARVDPTGQRQLSYFGRSDTAYSARITLTTYDLTTGRPFGTPAGGTIEYTTSTAERESEKVVGRMARAIAEAIQNR